MNKSNESTWISDDDDVGKQAGGQRGLCDLEGSCKPLMSCHPRLLAHQNVPPSRDAPASIGDLSIGQRGDTMKIRILISMYNLWR